jgi:hypothetical protein
MEMFTAVNEEKHVPNSQVVPQRFGQRTVRLFRDIECRGDAVGHERRIWERRQFHKPHSVRVLLQEVGCRPEGQTGFAATARARQGEQTRRAQKPYDLRDLPLASDKAAELGRKVVDFAMSRR